MKYIICFSVFISVFFMGFAQSTWKKLNEGLILNNAPFNACHASSIVGLSPGEMMVSFFAGSGEGNKDVSIWLATMKEGSWTKPYLIADGIVNDTLRFPCWNPVLFKSKDKTLFLFYKVGPNPREWWGMVKTSFDNGKSWTNPKKLPNGILGPIRNKPVQLEDGTILSPSSIETESSWKVHMERSIDMGKTWQVISVDHGSSYRVIQPGILLYPGGRIQIVCRSDQDRIVYAWSEDGGESWSRFQKLDLPNPNSGIDAVTLQNGTQLLVYNPTTRGKEWFNNRGKLNVAVSKDGINWKDIAVLENGDKEEYSYPAVIQAQDGRVHITYTYDRKNIKHVVLEEQGF